MSDREPAWKRNTPEARATRRAAWGEWCGGQSGRQKSDDTAPPGRRPEGYQRHRWT